MAKEPRRFRILNLRRYKDLGMREKESVKFSAINIGLGAAVAVLGIAFGAGTFIAALGGGLAGAGIASVIKTLKEKTGRNVQEEHTEEQTEEQSEEQTEEQGRSR